MINTVYAAYLRNKVVSGCAPDDEEDAGLIPLLVDRPTRDGRATAYVFEGYACRNPTTDSERQAQHLGISWRSADRRATFHVARRVYTRGR